MGSDVILNTLADKILMKACKSTWSWGSAAPDEGGAELSSEIRDFYSHWFIAG